MKGSMIVLGFFVAGICLGLSGAVTGDMLPGELTEWLLYALVVQIGLNLGAGGNLRKILKSVNARVLLLPVGTIIGTLAVTALAGWLVGGMSVADYLALGSGMGYYSLSSVLIIDIKSHSAGIAAATQLGMLAVLVNIMREMIALIAGPWFRRVSGRFAPIAAAGVTSMDVTLPMIVGCSGSEMLPVALLHGMALEVSVPLLVTLFASL